jgi:mono/diheme cytochrome c family protein
VRKALKWIGIILGVLVGVIVIFAVTMFIMGTSRLNKTYHVEPAVLSIPEDAVAIQRGEYLYSISCAGCHGEDLAGKAILDDPALGYFPASNLTSGQGGIGNYTVTDLVRAVRHGVGADGKPLMVMPAKAYWYFSDQDLGAILAYVKAAPAVDNEMGEKNAKSLGRILLALGFFGDILSAESIDHSGPRPSAPDHGVTVEYGEYLVNTGDCRNSHGPNLAGVQPPEPGAPFSANLTPGGVLAIWSADDFIETMRTGNTPYGRQLDSNFMPWKEYGRMNDDDLTALFLYLQSLSALDTPTK